MKKETVKTKISLNGIGTEIDLKKVVEINLSGDKEFIIFEKLRDGSWVMNYTKKTIPEIDSLKSIDLIRKTGE